jgi:hypothetical protein
MIICDLEVLEVVAEDNQVEGGIAFSDADAYASAYGRFFAATDSYTSTYAFSGYSYYYGSYSSASAFSSSSSTAY